MCTVGRRGKGGAERRTHLIQNPFEQVEWEGRQRGVEKGMTPGKNMGVKFGVGVLGVGVLGVGVLPVFVLRVFFFFLHELT